MAVGNAQECRKNEQGQEGGREMQDARTADTQRC